MGIEDYLDEFSINYEKNASTAKISSMKAGGIAKIVAYPTRAIELVGAIKLSKQCGLPYKILGNCSNVLFSDSGFFGVVISTARMKEFRLDSESDELVADCGVLYSYLVSRLSNIDLSISESLFGIPASVGGMIKNNAGAFGDCIGNHVISVEVFDTKKGEIYHLSKKELNFGYRSSAITKSDMVILSATFKLTHKSKSEIKNIISEITAKRRATQPKDASVGSFFKNPPGYHASKLIDTAGLKGLRCGGASVSQKHAGFIVNLGGATATDVLTLAKQIEDAVYKKYGILLEREAEII